MTDRTSAERRLKEAQNLAISHELLAYCDAQDEFVARGENEPALQAASRALARELRRRRCQPEVLLLAIEIAGGTRSAHLYGEHRRDGLARYHAALKMLLHYYHGAEARPSERRIGPR